jgi:acyl-[acyl-carrier-protein]-phospholipid O-acyltransferase/long-chain-fatty-acid--[acyl-carrier-protein] ligase
MYRATCLGLGALGLTAGLFDVPLQSYLQHYSPEQTRGSVLAAANFLAFAGMLAASAVFWVLRSPMGFSAAGIFLFSGGVALLVAALLLWWLSREAATALARPFKRMPWWLKK